MNTNQKLSQRKSQLLFTLLIVVGLWLVTANLSLPAAQAQNPNLALNKPVTCSSVENAGTACTNAVDGNTGTRWSSAHGVDPQWIRVDLGATNTIGRVVLRWEAAYGKSYQLQTSSDGTTWTNIYTTTTGDGGVDDVTVSGSGRYVRMNGTVRATQYGYSLWEFEVYGGSTPTRTPTLASTECDVVPITCTPTPTRTNTPGTPIAGDLGYGSVHGIVTNANTGAPIAGAMITCSHTSATSPAKCSGARTTAADGSYSFDNVFFHDTDTITVNAQASGYLSQTTQQNFFTTPNMTANFALVPAAPSVTPAGPLPDLVVTSVKGGREMSGSCATNLNLGINVTVQNTGTVNARYFLVEVNNNTGARKTVSGLAAGQSITVWFNLSPQPTTNTATVDVTNLVAESNEGNNTLTVVGSPGTVTPTGTPPAPCTPTPTATGTAPGARPDLVVQSMGISPNQSCYTPGFHYGVSVNVANVGTSSAGAFVVNVNGAQQTVSGGLLNGQSTSLWFPGYNSNTNTAIVDSTNLVTESNENNNILSQQLVSPTAPPPCVTPTPTNTAPGMLPDLVVNSIQPGWIWYDNCNGGGLRPNTNVMIQNNGPASAGTFQVALANPTGIISQTTVSGLAAGQFLTVAFVLNGHPLTTTVDSTNTVIESNENNNWRSTYIGPGTPGPGPTQTWTPSPPFPTCTPTPTATRTPTPTNTSVTPTRTNTPVPSGNLALNKPVVCSSIENTGTACANAVDGNTGTRWASAFSDPQWIRVDLGTTQSLIRIVLRWEAAYGKSYQLQTSNDGTTWTTIYSTTTGDGGIDDVPVSGSGRYVRMNGTVRATQYGYSLWEFEVYGPPVETVTGAVVVAGGACCWAATAGSSTNINASFSASSSAGAVTQMRVASQYGGGSCPTDLSQAVWEPFVTSKTFTISNVAINFVNFHVTVQYRDAVGNLSAVYCDSVAVEGMPPTPTRTPTPIP